MKNASTLLKYVYTHYTDVIMTKGASQITSLTIDQRKHQSSALLAFVRGIHRRPVTSPRKGLVTRKMLLFDDVIMTDMMVCKLLSEQCVCCASPALICVYFYITRELIGLLVWFPFSRLLSWVDKWVDGRMDGWLVFNSIVIFQIWRRSRHSRLPHERAQ